MITAPGGLPLAGHALDLLRRPLGFLTELRDLGPVVRFRLGPRDAYLVTTPDAVREVLVTQAPAFGKGGPLVEVARTVMGDGISTLIDQENHRRQRRMAQPAFHRQRIAGYTATMAGIGRRTYLPMGWVHRLPLPVNRRFDAAKRELDDLVRGAIAEYRANPADRGDLLSMFMAAVDEDGVGLGDTQLHDEVYGMMFAGVATTSEGLTWAFHALATHPEIEKKVQAEIDEVLGDRTVTFADLPALTYTKRVLSEVLRVYPPGWLLTRHSVRDAEVEGHLIPAGSDVFYSPYVLHHDPRSFPRPAEFDPDRWLTESPRHAYLPFSAGTRKCIGDSFAETEILVMLTAVLQRWRLSQVGEAVAAVDTTYRLKKCVMRVERR